MSVYNYVMKYIFRFFKFYLKINIKIWIYQILYMKMKSCLNVMILMCHCKVIICIVQLYLFKVTKFISISFKLYQ